MTQEDQPDEQQDKQAETPAPEDNKVPRLRAEMERLEEADTRDEPEPREQG